MIWCCEIIWLSKPRWGAIFPRDIGNVPDQMWLGTNHMVNTVQSFFQLFNKGIKLIQKAPKFIILYVVK